MARGTSSTQSGTNNKIIDQLHDIIRAGGVNNYVLRVDFIAILYLMRRFEEELKSHKDKYIGEVFYNSGKKDKDENIIDYDKYRFSRLNEVTDASDLQNYINNEVIPFYKDLPSIVRYSSAKNPSIYETNFYKYTAEFFRDASVQKLKSGRLKEVISLVSDIESKTILSDDFLGDAIESAFANSTASERKQMGLFRTPKHIRDLMVNLVEPNIKDKIYDPAVGTAGFLISAKNYIFDHPDISKISEKDLQKFYFEGLGGMEQDMFLHRFAMMVALTAQVNPLTIKEGDSLGEFDYARDRESYSLILTNPPFGGKKNQDHYSNLWAMNSSETTVLFLKLVYELLQHGGRCAVVVSEGMNTWGDSTSIEMRRIIAEDCTLDAIISLPQGVFQNPKGGSGPKTSIYLFKKLKSPKDHKVFFYQINNDGYSIGTNRKPIEGSQIPNLLEIWEYYKVGNYDKIDSENCTLVSITKILCDDNYSFNISSYLSGISPYLIKEYQKQAMQIQENLSSVSKPIQKLQESMKSIAEPLKQLQKEIQDATKIMQIHNWKFKEDLAFIDKKLKASLGLISKIDLSEIECSFPQFTDIINEHQALAKNVLKRGNKYPLVLLSDILEQYENKITINDNENYKQITISNTGEVKLREIKPGKEIGTKKQNLVNLSKANLIIYSRLGLHTGSIGLIPVSLNGAIATVDMPIFKLKMEGVEPQYLALILKSQQFIGKIIKEKPTGAAQTRFHEDKFLQLKIPLPPIEEQKEILEITKNNEEQVNAINKIIEGWKFNLPLNSSEFITLGDSNYFEILGGGTPNKSKTEYWKGNIPWVSPKDMKKFIITDTTDHITKNAVDKSSTKMIPANSILIVVRSGILKHTLPVAINKIEVSLNQDLKAIIIKKGFDHKFIAFYIKEKEKELLNQVRNGPTVEGINLQILKEFKIPLLNMEEQKSISSKIAEDLHVNEKLLLRKTKLIKQNKKIINRIWEKE